MAGSTLTTTGSITLTDALVKNLVNAVKGHSTLAKLTASAPLAFSGSDNFVFTLDGEAAIVGEGAAKPAGTADWKTVTIRPIKFVYQHRVTEEFDHMAEEKQMDYLTAFVDGLGKKMARALDIAAFHGVNPATGSASTSAANNFTDLVTNTVTYTSGAPDDNVDSAVALIQAADYDCTGIAMTPAFASALGAMKGTGTGLAIYPEFRFGNNPGKFGSMVSDVNNTLAYGSSDNQAIVGDFENMFKWGYADNMPIEVIRYGAPDGGADLKATNEILFRTEAYIGWGILDPAAFARVVNP